MMIVGRRRAGTTLRQHQRHIRYVHGALVAEYIAMDPKHAPRRYVQNRVLDGTFRQATSNEDPFSLNRDFVTEIWFDDPTQAAESVRQSFYLDRLRPDEDRFVDQGSVVKLAVREQVLEPAPEQGAHCKLFVFHGNLAPGFSGHDLTDWRAWSQSVAAAAKEITPCGHTQNQILGSPGVSPLVGTIDEFWLKDTDSVHALAEVLNSILMGQNQAGAATPGVTHCMLMAEETVLYKGSTP